MANEPTALTDEEAILAASQEEQDRLVKENKSLRNRTAFLRAMMNRLAQENADLRAQLTEEPETKNEENPDADV